MTKNTPNEQLPAKKNNDIKTDIFLLGLVSETSFADSIIKRGESSSESFSSSVFASRAQSSSTSYLIQTIRDKINHPPLRLPTTLDQKSTLECKKFISQEQASPVKDKQGDDTQKLRPSLQETRRFRR